jgi:hypothetical protein
MVESPVSRNLKAIHEDEAACGTYKYVTMEVKRVRAFIQTVQDNIHSLDALATNSENKLAVIKRADCTV